MRNRYSLWIVNASWLVGFHFHTASIPYRALSPLTSASGNDVRIVCLAEKHVGTEIEGRVVARIDGAFTKNEKACGSSSALAPNRTVVLSLENFSAESAYRTARRGDRSAERLFLRPDLRCPEMPDREEQCPRNPRHGDAARRDG